MPTGVHPPGLPATQALPPMVGLARPALSRRSGDHRYLCHGGHEFDGREISAARPGRAAPAARRDRGERDPLGRDLVGLLAGQRRVRAASGGARRRGAARRGDHLSHEIGRIGLLERENATIMNACLRDLASQIVEAFNAALAEFGIEAPVYLCQNDGTLMASTTPSATRWRPSPPGRRTRCAAPPSSRASLDCAVVDIGGTTSDVGMLQHGFPREASIAVEIGGVRTNFRMPDVLSFGLGGGLARRRRPDDRAADRRLRADAQRALVFGGDVLTATDLAVAAGLAEIGDPERVAALDRRS